MGDMPGDNILKIDAHWDFPSGPRLKLHLFTTVGMGSIPGTKIPGASWCGQKKKKKRRKKRKTLIMATGQDGRTKKLGLLALTIRKEVFSCPDLFFSPQALTPKGSESAAGKMGEKT